jgi:hypothetical protein
MLDSFKRWWDKPYSDDMSASGWFLFFGLLIVISVAWALVLRELKEVAK